MQNQACKEDVRVEKLRRNDRMSAMMKILSDSPNRIFTLSNFCELFGTAKSTMSEDIDLLRDMVKHFGLGELETVTGAAGGVRYRNTVDKRDARAYIEGLCEQMSGAARVLPCGYLYDADILCAPEHVDRLGAILATEYYDAAPDFVLTMETKGIPVAYATARNLGVPLVIARRFSKVYEGSAVYIDYVSGSSGSLETMSLARRSVKEGQKCLIVDDFLKGGGTAKGMTELMREFNVEVVGMAFMLATVAPAKKRVTGAKSLMTLDFTGEEQENAVVRPADWLMA